MPALGNRSSKSLQLFLQLTLQDNSRAKCNTKMPKRALLYWRRRRDIGYRLLRCGVLGVNSCARPRSAEPSATAARVLIHINPSFIIWPSAK